MNKTEITTTQNPLEEIEGNKQSLIFQTQDGLTRIQVELEEETVWLTQEQMSILFGKGRTTITEHIRNIFLEGELQESKVCRKFRHTTQHGAITKEEIQNLMFSRSQYCDLENGRCRHRD